MPLLSVEDLHVHYGSAHAPVRAVDGVSLALDAGETLGLVGESGCGKSTLSHAILRLGRPTSGRIVFEGQDITTQSRRKLAPVRSGMQMIFQDPYASLNPRQTIRKILTAPLHVHGIARGREAAEIVTGMAEAVGLGPDALDRFPHEFSGGQRQRIGIARALILKPRLVICDEPVSALDLSIQAQILNLLRRLQAERGPAYLFISHDLSVVRYISDRIAVMYLGRIVEMAPAHRLWQDPLHPYTRALIGAIPDATRRRAPDLLPPETGGRPAAGCRFANRCPLASARCLTEDPALHRASHGHQVACHHPGTSAAAAVA
ncbi:MAG: peptide ABC transporter ATP-binding protein [Rhodobacteraceae bacterium]|nr:peptide ABC transporter ATP-binding protein [Paracoccaceae bacterium]